MLLGRLLKNSKNSKSRTEIKNRKLFQLSEIELEKYSYFHAIDNHTTENENVDLFVDRLRSLVT